MRASRVWLVLALAGAAAAQNAVRLAEGWRIESSERVKESGETVSRPGFDTTGWYRAQAPSTVLAALVAERVFADPYFGMNLRQIPGAVYPVGTNFSNLPMAPGNPFRVPWWYRTEFRLPEEFAGRTVWLRLGGINYRAEIWLNGRRLADPKHAAGAFRVYEFNVTELVSVEGLNALAVQVWPPQPDDLAITWVDWNPAPPDKNMGLWQEVTLSASGPVAVRHPHVVTKLDGPATARLTVMAELCNVRPQSVRGVLRGRIGEIEFQQPVELAAGETRAVAFTPERFPQLVVRNPRLWWPWHYGEPHLYDLTLEYEVAGAVSDRVAARFGIREVTSELTPEGYRRFQINGRPILIRGAGWAPDMLLRENPERQEAELRYVRDMHLNAVRLEGKLENEGFYEWTDRMGILVMAGWCCCDHWERWRNWKPEDYEIAAASLRDQIRRLRRHPSVFVWLNGSDNPPPEKVEQMYVDILRELAWPNPYLSSATEKETKLTGATGVKMRGPYEYVPPSYWYADTQRGGAFGFATEVGPGPAPPPLESLVRMLPRSKLWPINEEWEYHAGGGPFRTLEVFTQALERRYGPARDVGDYAKKAQVLAYETHRAMFEAFGRNKYRATGVIQWMLNNAWPSMIWHLYDYYLRPGGSYFGAKKACEPLHIQYSPDDRSVVVVNSYLQDFRGLKARARVYDFDLKQRFVREEKLDVAADESRRIFTLPPPDGLSSTYFLWLDLEDAEGKSLSRNFYWLSTKHDTLDWERSTWYYTPQKEFADLRMLEKLAPVALKLSSRREMEGGEPSIFVTVENPGPGLAFAVRLKILRGVGGDEVLPVLWEDNYLALLPGEKREIKARIRSKDLGKAQPVAAAEGWNAAPVVEGR